MCECPNKQEYRYDETGNRRLYKEELCVKRYRTAFTSLSRIPKDEHT